MPTSMYLRSAAADVSRGTNDLNKLGSNSAWNALTMNTTISTGTNVTDTVATVTGPTSGLELGSPVTHEWISPPLSAAVTISGTITFNICALESNAMANSSVGVVVQRLSNTLSVVSTVVDSLWGTELGTTNAKRTWTATPTSTAFAKGDRIRVRVYFDDNATTGNMVTGYTLTLNYDGTLAGVGDSNVTFTENLSFMSPPQVGWTKVFSSGIGASTNIIMYSSSLNLFVRSGTNWQGTSSDGVNWTSRALISSTQAINDGVWASGLNLFIVVGTGGVIYTSPDGITWTLCTSNTAETLNGIAYDATTNRLVACGSNSALVTSTNGTTWTTVTTSLVAPNYVAIKYYASWGWVMVASGLPSTLLRSSDGTTWTITTSLNSINKQITPIAYDDINGVWIITDIFVGNLYTSTDLVTWTLRYSTVASGSISNSTINCQNGKCVVVGLSQPLVSTNGITWNATVVEGGTSSALRTVAYGSGPGVWVSSGGDQIIASKDGFDGVLTLPTQKMYMTGLLSGIANQGTDERVLSFLPGVS